MAQQAAPDRLIAGRYEVDFARPASVLGPRAFACADRASGRADLAAILIARDLPPRARVLSALIDAPVEGAVMPLAHGPVTPPGAAEEGYAIVCEEPRGQPLSAAREAWTERALLEQALIPAAAALDRLAQRGLAHRAVRADNVFRAGPGRAVVLGPCWAAPPASRQPAAWEPPYVAMCHPSGRGDGDPADDVYALGVLLLTLVTGRPAMHGLDEAAVIRRKLDLGSHAALAGEARLPPTLAELLRGMLADDPEQRPSAAALADPHSARARRMPARPPRRAALPLDIAGRPAWTPRAAAFEIARDPARGAELLRAGAIDGWLRRQAGQAEAAALVEDAARLNALERGEDEAAADSMLVARAVALIDPLAPLCWRGLALWPDGIGPVLAAGGDAREAAHALLAGEAVGAWAALRAARMDAAMTRIEARRHAATLSGRGPARLAYQLNPLLPCASPILAGRWVARLPDLLPALEAAGPQGDSMDADVAAFVSARAAQLNDDALAARPRESPLAVLSRLQSRFGPPSLPALAQRLVAQAEASLTDWRSRGYRRDAAERLRRLALEGRLAPMLELLESRAAREADAAGAARARTAVAAIDAALLAAAESGAARAELAARLGQEIAVGAGIAALSASFAWRVLL